MRTVVLTTMAWVVACSNAWSTRLSDNAYSIECNNGLQGCAEEARELCPRGYDVLYQNQRPEVIVHQSSSGSMVMPVRRANLIARCR